MRLLLLALALYAGAAHADESLTGAYAGVSAGRATLHRVDIYISDFEAHDTGFKALAGYRILKGLTLEASYSDYGEMVRGAQLIGKIDAFSIDIVGLIPLGQLDLFGKAGAGAWKGKLSADDTGRLVRENDLGPELGLGLQYRRERFAIRAEVEILGLSYDSDDITEQGDNWIDFVSVGVSWRF